MATKISFDLVSPERLLLSDEADMVTVPATEGYMGVMAGHAPVVTTLRAGMIDVSKDGTDTKFFIRGGFAEISAAKITDLHIGAFKVPREKFGVAPLPQFALQQGSSKIAGILGMDTLYICHAIIDLDGMNLFLK